MPSISRNVTKNASLDPAGFAEFAAPVEQANKTAPGKGWLRSGSLMPDILNGSNLPAALRSQAPADEPARKHFEADAKPAAHVSDATLQPSSERDSALLEDEVARADREDREAMQRLAKTQDGFMPLMCDILEETIAFNDQTKQPPAQCLEFFDGKTAPLSATKYVQRIMKYSKCSSSNVVVGLLYLERLKSKRKNMRLTSSNLQRLLLVAIMEATKFWEDFYYDNVHWAKIAGITLKELNLLELDFLFAITFEMGVTIDQYKTFLTAMTGLDEARLLAPPPATPQPPATRLAVAAARPGAAPAAPSRRAPEGASQSIDMECLSRAVTLDDVSDFARAQSAGAPSTHKRLVPNALARRSGALRDAAQAILGRRRWGPTRAASSVSMMVPSSTSPAEGSLERTPSGGAQPVERPTSAVSEAPTAVHPLCDEELA